MTAPSARRRPTSAEREADGHRRPALGRFVEAQDAGGAYERALGELRAGRKVSHWMWFVFPQLAGLGESPTSRRYAIASLRDAVAYLAHPVLGPRLRRAATTLLDSGCVSATALLGPLDARKLRSSMTLFSRADPGDEAFRAVLERYFDGETDPRTDALLAAT